MRDRHHEAAVPPIPPRSCAKKVRYATEEEAQAAVETIMEERLYIGGRSVRGVPNVYSCGWGGFHWHWGHRQGGR